MSSPRLKYSLGDIAATIASCSAIAALTGLCVPAGWTPLWAMLFGMVAGMLLSIPCCLVSGTLLGVIEPMLQIMLAGMVAGMVAAMHAAQDPDTSLTNLVALGIQCGAATGLAVVGADWLLRSWGTDE